MNFPNNVLDNLVNTFFTYYPTEENKRSALILYKIFNFDYKDKKLIYEGKEIKEYSYAPSSLENIGKTSDDTNWVTSKSLSVTPYSFSSFDVDCINTALNKNKTEAPYMSPIMDALGWIIRFDGTNYSIHFIGGSVYDMWKDLDKYNVEDENADWKSGNDWLDGIDLEKDIPKNWTD